MDATQVPGIEEFMREPSYAESCRVFHEREREELRARWVDFHLGMHTLHSRLAAEHEAKAAALLEDPPSKLGVSHA